MESIPESDQAANVEQNALGIKWNLFNDTFSVPSNSTDKIENVFTKRGSSHDCVYF